MLVAGLVLAGIAALVHVWIFYLESVVWTGERARATFRSGTVQEAEALRFMAFNQGFYNLFLAVVTAVGIVVRMVGDHGIGQTLVLTGTGSMLAAAVVLFAASPPHRPAAVKQGLVPLLSVVAIVLSVAT